MAMTKDELRKELTARLGRAFKPQVDQILKNISDADIKYLQPADVEQLARQAGGPISSKTVSKVIAPARDRYIEKLSERAKSGDLDAQQELQDEGIKEADKAVDEAKKSGTKQDQLTAEQQRAKMAEEAALVGVLGTAQGIIRDTLTADDYWNAKSLFEEETGQTVDATEWQKLVQVQNPDAVDALRLAKGVQDQVEWTVKVPGGERVSVGSVAVQQALQKFLPGSTSYNYIVGDLMVKGKSDLDEAQWLPFLVASHGVFDETYTPMSRPWRDVGMTFGGDTDYAAQSAAFAGSAEEKAAGLLKRKKDAGSLSDKFNGYLTQFGKENPIAAFVATFDEDLAKRMTTEGLEAKELAAVQAKIFRGVDPGDIGIVGDALKYYSKDYLKSLKESKGPTIVLPDREKIADGFRELYRSWFRAEPEEGELQALIDQVRSQYAADAASNINPDVGAKMKNLARGSSLYERLMGNRPTGVSEEDYIGQMENIGRNLLGGEVAPDSAVQAGLQAGSASATVGAVYGNRQLLENNSTLRERIAQAAQLINENT